MARVSVLLPVRNGEAYLAEAIESILVQTESNLELIIIDDGSIDDSGSIIESFSLRDPRIRFFRQPSLGLVETLNRGLGLARCSLVARMDADDISHPERIALQADYLEAHQHCVAVGSAISIISADGSLLREVAYPSGNALLEAMEEGSALAHPAVMFRRESVLSVGGYRSAFRHAEDYDLWLRLMEIGELENLPEALLRYRQHQGQVSTRHAIDQATSTEFARQLHKLRRGGKPEPSDHWNTILADDDIAAINLPSTAIAEILLKRLHRVVIQEGADVRRAWGLFKLLSNIDRESLANVDVQSSVLRIAVAAWRRGNTPLASRIIFLALFSAPTEFLASFRSLARARTTGR